MRKILPLLALLLVPQIAFAGSITYSTPGTYTFTVPTYGTMDVAVKGAGGGGGGGANDYMWDPSIVPNPAMLSGGYGGDGGNSSFGGSLIAYGGHGGGPQVFIPGGLYATNGLQPAAASSGATGGDTNSTGGGAPGGAGGWMNIHWAYYPYTKEQPWGGHGGAGGLATKTYASGALSAGSTITVVVGASGAGGLDTQLPSYTGWNCQNWGTCPVRFGDQGTAGSVTITWTDAAPPPLPPAPTVSNQSAHSINIGQAGSANGLGNSLNLRATDETSLEFDPVAFCNAPDSRGNPRSKTWIRNCLSNLGH